MGGKIQAREAEKYSTAWSMPGYLEQSPGEVHSDMFKDVTGCKPGDSVIDFGCGAGAGGKALKEKYDLDVTFFDLERYAGCPDPFIQGSLWEPIPASHEKVWDFGYCCDVMEHLPEQFTMLAVHNMLNACRVGIFFSISFLPDHFGKFVGEPLHLTVRPFVWWRDTLQEMGELVAARDFFGEGVFYVRP
jgi:predicted TPR repeat methyltransferase